MSVSASPIAPACTWPQLPMHDLINININIINISSNIDSSHRLQLSILLSFPSISTKFEDHYMALVKDNTAAIEASPLADQMWYGVIRPTFSLPPHPYVSHHTQTRTQRQDTQMSSRQAPSEHITGSPPIELHGWDRVNNKRLSRRIIVAVEIPIIHQSPT